MRLAVLVAVSVANVVVGATMYKLVTGGKWTSAMFRIYAVSIGGPGQHQQKPTAADIQQFIQQKMGHYQADSTTCNTAAQYAVAYRVFLDFSQL